MAKKKINFKVSSVTVDGKKVLDGCFKLFDTHGLPLDTILELCIEYNMIPNWIDFYDDALNSGWSEETLCNRLETALIDIHGIEYCNEIMDRLKIYSRRINE